jgi:hypothetical protein
MPAATMARMMGLPPQVRTVSGSLWSGRAGLDGGLTLTWQMTLRGLALGRLGADLRLTGPRTLLEGSGFASVTRVGVQDLSGRAGPDLLALAPDAAACDGQANVRIASVSWARGAVESDGRVQITPSVCQGPGGNSFETPALDLVLTTAGNAAVATLTTDDTARDSMGNAQIRPDGWVNIRIEPAAARLLPGLPTSAPTVLEFQLY